ncbi:MAG: class I SAM-dependent RNA methyltransferase [Clostridia bacterium]|nr:class I SAM-dependent RNA methyltransferase [Clostridia bacterium]
MRNGNGEEAVRMTAVCLFGLEKLVGEELDDLSWAGVRRTETIDGRVFFDAPLSAIPVLNLRLRCAERVLILLARFHAETFEDLFEGVRQVRWEDWIGREDRFPVKGHSVKSRLFSIPDCQKIIKKATADRLSSAYGLKWLPETGVLYQIEFLLLKDEAFVMLDTTGETLHKRGYRPAASVAPLRETLAAAMVRLSRPREGVLTVDPLCGSGTIVIEAAMLAENRAPGLGRTFSSESFPFLPGTLWREAREKCLAEIRPAGGTLAYGSDLDPKCVELSRANAARAVVESAVSFSAADVRSFRSPVEGARGTIVTNPPYGERIGTVREARELARAMGEAFRREIPRWQLYILSSDEDYESAFGRRADKVRKLYNGMIPCRLYQFFKNPDSKPGAR